MSTPGKTPISIRAEFLGPVFSLDAQLGAANQALIFARNGTGKSFLSRAFRYLDLHGQQQDITDAPSCLISEESVDGKGLFSISRGDATLGELHLEHSKATATIEDTIFHVFSEDFVQDELRERQYIIDGTIENQIAIDRGDIRQQELTEQLKQLEESIVKKYKELHDELDAARTLQLQKRAAVNRSLKEYVELTADRLVSKYKARPDSLDIAFTEILRDLATLRSLPLDPQYPSAITPSNTRTFL